MYHQEIDISHVTRNEEGKVVQTLVGLWILADKLLIPSLQNVMIK
jgi:hypothetical protein